MSLVSFSPSSHSSRAPVVYTLCSPLPSSFSSFRLHFLIGIFITWIRDWLYGPNLHWAHIRCQVGGKRNNGKKTEKETEKDEARMPPYSNNVRSSVDKTDARPSSSSLFFSSVPSPVRHYGLPSLSSFYSLLSVERIRYLYSPRGNGIDCHRTWESLYLDRTPIIDNQQETLKKLWLNEGDLPVVLVENMRSPTHLQQLADAHPLLQLHDGAHIPHQYPRLSLTPAYWWNEIQSVIQEDYLAHYNWSYAQYVWTLGRERRRCGGSKRHRITNKQNARK